MGRPWRRPVGHPFGHPVGRAGALLLAWLVLGACDRNLEPFDPEVEPVTPDLSRIFPAPPDGERPGQAAAVMPDPVRGNTGAGEARPGTGESIRGRVVLAPGVSSEAAPGATLFIIARSAGATAGPPLAVQRIPQPRFPLDFEIGPENVMIPTLKFEGEITLSARLDSDGNATTRLPGDLQGSLAGSVRPGSAGVEIRLDQQI